MKNDFEEEKPFASRERKVLEACRSKLAKNSPWNFIDKGADFWLQSKILYFVVN